MTLVGKLDGRLEKRLAITIVIRLTQLREQCAYAAELTYTNNVSAHGVCAISGRPWKLGEMMEVTALEDEVPLRGKVVHCHKHTDKHYAVGLAFNGSGITWSRYRKYAHP